MAQFRTFSKEQTVEVGLKLGSILKAGDIVCLIGGLGAGKTAFTGGLAAALGVDGYITSPTFTLVNEYQGRMPLYHFDVYRVGSTEEMFEIGFEEYIDGDGIVVVEWADIIKDIIPHEHIRVEIKTDDAVADARTINIDFIGKRYEAYEAYEAFLMK